jgi:cobalt-zinc-cadmium efflux system protein
MGHDHSHHHHHHPIGENEKPTNIIIAFWLNTAFALLEIVGGLYTNSMAIISDAVHDLGDSLSLGLAYYFHQKSKQKRDQHFSYGYRRFSLLGAFVNSLILIVTSAFVIQESFFRLFEPVQPDANGMVVLALLGVSVNAYAMFKLKKGKSVNERVISLHFLEDVLGWAAVLVGSVVMMFVHVPVLDPILSLVIAAYILWNVYKSLKTTFRILLQANPENVDEENIRKRVLSVPGVKAMHDLHFWTMDGQYNILTLHIVVEGGSTVQETEVVKKEVKHLLQHLDIQHATVEVEPDANDCAFKEC